ncbi:MAG: toll/interleukin-1 receptor domain-containing protein [Kiritimatiellae bacterium]|nr:toll/interleukin-1 receptor domain-containing protein [Kiritimatiellia bacterium]
MDNSNGNPQAVAVKMAEFSDLQWDTLIYDYVANGLVVPVVGPELLVAKGEDSEVPFYSAAAQRLAQASGLPPVAGETMDALFARARNWLGRTDDMTRNALTRVLEGMADEPQPHLRALVETGLFPLILSTTPDRLLARTIESAAGQAPEEFYFCRNNKSRADLPAMEVPQGVCWVYGIFGQARRGIHYAVTEDDRLEYASRWMDGVFRPSNLISALDGKYLLVLGCGYENWLARFFLYGLKRDALFSARGAGVGVLADSRASRDAPLEAFLSRCHGYIYGPGGGADFVAELARRVREAGIRPSIDLSGGFREKSIFISYGRQENPAEAFEVKRRLEACGIPVWLDTDQLQSGDDYDRKIERNIRHASFFLPILSKPVAQSMDNRYFRKEWDIAADVARMAPPGRPFIHPIVVDDLVLPHEGVHDALNARQAIAAPGGRIGDADLARIVELARQIAD